MQKAEIHHTQQLWIEFKFDPRGIGMKKLQGRMALAIAVALCGVSSSGLAATATAPMAVTAIITNLCSVNTVALAFAELSLVGVTNSTGAVNVTCTIGGTYTVSLDSGLHATGSQRNLTSLLSNNVLSYNVYSDSARSIPWLAASPNVVTGIGTGLPQPLIVYGQIPANQTIVVGAYLDTIQVTVTY